MAYQSLLARSALISALSLLPLNSAAELPDEAPHDVLVALLNESDSVIPPTREGHPVANMYNREGVVPPQCYTQTQGRFNPCYVCHQDGINGRENQMNDRDLQVEYSFSELGGANHWTNLFEDRSERVAAMSDQAIREYIGQDNYSELAGRLNEASFQGWVPDLKDLHLAADAFDGEGFAKDGSDWVAFNYKPMPSSFWPTNGSTDDVMIRLPQPFRLDALGNPSKAVYKANLAILEANMKGVSEIGCLPLDESKFGIDLDDDGELGTINRIKQVGTYVGAAASFSLSTHLYPAGTEFLHTVRYVGLGDNDEIIPSKRMKEVRYMKKWSSYAKPIYERQYQTEAFEKDAGHLPGYISLGQWGLDNGIGWSIQGFIEDSRGRLRASTFEENFFCMGCHNSVGATVDKTFSFVRKIDGANGWGYIDLKDMPDNPSMGETKGEYATYMERVGGGSEFRNNIEMFEKWFLADGSLDHEKVASAKDIHELITPSVERALDLNKAYKAIVEDQDFIYGRDATVTPPKNVYDSIDNIETPTLPEEFTYDWNIILDWSQLPTSDES